MPLTGSARSSLPAILALLAVGPACQARRLASLVYPPPGDPAAAPAPPPGAPVVALGAVSDERAGRRDLVGAYERVPQAEMPVVRLDLVTADDVPGWVRGALGRELELAGLSVQDPAAASGAPAVDAAIRKLSCEASEDSRIYASRVELRAVVRGPAGALLDGTYRGRVDLAVALGDDVTDDGIARCLAAGLRDAARKIAADTARAVIAAPAAAPAPLTPVAPPAAPP